ncbi:MAG: dihydroneopterin aldolase [Bacteroidales bacterium]
MGKLELKEMKFFSNHGCFEEERTIGNPFIVDFEGEYNTDKVAETDNLDEALNYQLIFNIIKEEMAIPSNLLENVAGRILKRIKKDFPELESASISIAKMNPPLGGQVGSSRMTLSF